VADSEALIPPLLAHLTDAAGLSCAAVFETMVDGPPEAPSRLRFQYPPLSPNSAAILCRVEDWPRAQHYESFLIIPLQIEGATWGCLGVADRASDRAWTAAENSAFRALGNLMSAALARERVEDALEQRVQNRTRELTAEVIKRQTAHATLAHTQSRLLQTSHRAGMAEVATGVLHNVGNVLNSINVSLTLVRQQVKDSEVASLIRVAGLLEEHQADLAAYLTVDAKGKRIPGFILQLARHLQGDCALMTEELEQCSRNVSHIKEIVAVQQSYARISGVLEDVAAEQLLEDALQITRHSLEERKIHIMRDFEPAPNLMVDKHKALQILINLIRNARSAFEISPPARKELTVSIRRGADSVKLAVADNGIGISPENLTRIFAHGFTTRKDGHGFGLHSGANAAREMGGVLRAASAGPGLGATFTLELPTRHEKILL
jgi:C4-dicarboxylate-specific signal transduction histidine kinase